MDFNEKLRDLRKQRGLTQEELAKKLYVSRTAVSKWESGKGYPGIDMLKSIAKYFSVSIDELLSDTEIFDVAEQDVKRKENNISSLVFGLLDISVIMFLFLPFFGQSVSGIISEVSLLNLTEIAMWLKVLYIFVVTAIILVGVLMLALQNLNLSFWERNKNKVSLILNVLGTFVFIISTQPYAAAFLFVFLIIKSSVAIKRH